MELSPREYDLMELRRVAHPATEEGASHRGDRREGVGGEHQENRGGERRADGGAAVADGPAPWAEAGSQASGAVEGGPRQPPAAGGGSPSRPEPYSDDVPGHLRASPGREGREPAGPRRDEPTRASPTRGGSDPDGRSELAYAALTGAASQERPYLRTLPGGAATELLVFRWLEGLVERGGIDGAHDALDYYRTIEWLTEDAASHLQDYLVGVPEPAGEPPGLTTEDHRTSLEFIVHIGGRHGD